MGYTWDQLNSYESPVVSTIMRIGQFSSALTVVLDPIIYFWVNPELRKAFRKSFGISETTVTDLS